MRLRGLAGRAKSSGGPLLITMQCWAVDTRHLLVFLTCSSWKRKLMKANSLLLILAIYLAFSSPAAADEKLAGLACRSVHLQYKSPAGTAFYNEVTVDQSAPGTYFCVCGFNHGYFGIQQIDDKKKVGIFSVWDPGKQDNPNEVEEKE